MFKARDRNDGSDVIILRVASEDLSDLRDRGREGQLACPRCSDDVIVRAGEINRPHYAHRRRVQSCNWGQDHPHLLYARAALYSWLRTKYDDNITVEQQLDDCDIPRPIDCWATRNGKTFAYWIVDSPRSAVSQADLRTVFARHGAHLTTVFLSDIIRRWDTPTDRAVLTPMERQSAYYSELDTVYGGGPSIGTLHYLDVQSLSMISFRRLHCVKGACHHLGAERVSPLADVTLSPRTGEFVHPQEWTKLQQLRATPPKPPPPSARPWGFPPYHRRRPGW